jgi:hypothetical protein
MGIGASLFLIAVGAILKFAVTADLGGVRLGTIGVILMVVGALGLVVTLIIWAPRSRPPKDYPRNYDDDVVDERQVYGRRRPPY